MINGSLEHIFLGFLATFISLQLWKTPMPAVAVMLTVEAVQIDVFGIDGRVVDTFHDLAMDGVGLFLSLQINF
ncbi:MAG: hypothetical protein ACE5IR_11805 [bacterium]